MANCNICDSTKTEKILDWKEYDIMKCNNCKLIFSLPLPSDLELQKFYQGFMFNKLEAYEITKNIKTKTEELKKLFNLSNNSEKEPKKKFLDFGGGTGLAYKSALDLGLESYYQDLDKEAEAFSKEHFGLTPEFIIEDIQKSDIKFDLIFSDNVIEHVQDPIGFTDMLVNQLDNGGTVVIKTPHVGNTETLFNPFIAIKGYFLRALKYNSLAKSIKAYFKRFWHCDPPRHLYSFSKKSLIAITEKLNYEGIEHEILYYQTAWFTNTITKEFFSKDKKLTLLKSIAIRLVIWPIVPIEVTLQVMKHFLLAVKIISPGGIILKITKK